MSTVFDIIFAGGGTAACVIAGRLAAADPSLKILIVESGQHSRDVPQHVQPCKFVENLAPGSTTIFSYISKPSPYLNGRSVTVSSGRCVGGGSAVNFMFYVRGAASDYDDWSVLGNEGWSFTELLPLIRKIETFAPVSDSPTHGYSGPVSVSTGGAALGIGKQFLDVARAYDQIRSQTDDNNDFKTPNAYSPAYKYINPVTGKRSDAASAYLYPHMENPNLKIVVGKLVKRVIVENGRAVGIEYTTDSRSDELFNARASKMVIISAGSIGSPAILERSGIGAPSVLKKNDVPILVDLPGVGENYMDHYGVCPVFYASEETDTMHDVWADPQAFAARLPEWERDGTGKIAHNGIEAVAKVRLTAAQLASVPPALRLRWDTFFRDSPDKPLGMILACAGYPLDPMSSKVLGRKLFAAVCFILYPESCGSYHITSGENPNAPREFEPGFFSKPGDIPQLILLYKMLRERTRRMSAYRGEVASYHPKFPPGSPAACRETDGPVPTDAPDIVYSDADDEAIENYIRDTVTTLYHSLGTCAMKPRNQGGVVDAHLNVYGVEGLKVADMSICPSNVGNNTYSTALLIGEKAATIIAEELGITLK